jgi:hypothetical protein
VSDTETPTRTSWPIAVIGGLVVHLLLFILVAATVLGALSRFPVVMYAVLLGIGILATCVAGLAGHVHGVRRWVVAGLLVIPGLYVALYSLLLVLLQTCDCWGF